jgi:hypothetical protein
MSEELKQLQEQDQLNSYSVFIFAMNSNVTKRKYMGRFVRFLDYIYTNNQHKNPLLRIAALDSEEDSKTPNYGKEKYR